jgi:AraC-like DNA-binding protein
VRSRARDDALLLAPEAARLAGTDIVRTVRAATHDSIEMSRLILRVVAAAGTDASSLAHAAGLPRWLLATDEAMVASSHHNRLWELAEHALQDPAVGLTAVAHHQIGVLGLYDYLFTSANTVRDALWASADFLYLVSTNCVLRPETGPDGHVTCSYRHVLPGGRGEELWTQFSIAALCARLGTATGRRVTPLAVTFTQPPPRRHQVFVETFGTRRIEFAAPATTVTLRAADVDLPLTGADPALARLLRRYATTLPRPEPQDLIDRFQQLLSEELTTGRPSLEVLARRLAVSTRTLQRRLGEHGTNWRAELETARQRHAQRGLRDGRRDLTRLARQLGYSDPRSVRRALRRWENT